MGILDTLQSADQYGGLLNGLPASWQYDPRALTSPERQMMALVGGAAPSARSGQDDNMGLSMPQPGPAAFTDGAPGIIGASPLASAPNMSAFMPPLSLGGPPQQVAPTSQAIAQDQPQSASPVIAPPDPRDGQPLTDSERQMMSLVQQPSGAQLAPSTASAAAPAGPIAIGNYQMPRIGNAAQFTPVDDDEDETPAAAKPTAGVGTPGAPTAPPAAPFSLAGATNGLGDRLSQGFKGFAANMQGGPIGALMGGIAGLSGMGRGSPEQQQAQVANLTAKALLAKGVDPAIVAAAVAPGSSPDLIKTLIAQNFGPDKFQHVTQKDQFGGETIGAFDPTTGKTTFQGGASGNGAAPSGGVQSMIDTITQKREAGASREDLIKEIPPAYQGYVSGLLDGKAIPANVGRGAARGALMTLAHTIDPTFDETMIPARIQTAKDFTPQGKSGASIVAFNTVQHHIGKLSDDFENLGTAGQGGFQAVNSFRNGLAMQTPFDPARQKAVQAVNDDIKAVTDEMSAAYKAGHVSDSEIKSWNSLVNSNLPLPAARQAISDFVDLLNGKRDALNKVHQQIMGGDAAIIDKSENEMITKKAHDRNAGMGAAAAAPGGALLQPGQSTTIGNIAIKRVN